RDGVVVFEDLSLDDVVDEINRYRPGRVVLMNSALARHRLSARFSIASLDEAITHIEQMYEATVRRVGNVVLIS
ncbi:MAG TPA: iron dicitrate transport regulator FecR, partial [Pusillimonas sp.]|nr:iron dicitrate transport regulator FecR [Pusillimonas sp.]